MKIIYADKSDNETLTMITKKSKAYWGFSEDVLKVWEDLLTVTGDYIENNKVFKLIQNEQVIGYYSFSSVNDSTLKLDNIFILPEFIRKGFGKILMEDFIKKAKLLNIKKITLDAEPNAENFYKNFGFKTIGKLESSIKDRYLPIMELKIENKNNS